MGEVALPPVPPPNVARIGADTSADPHRSVVAKADKR